MAARGGRGGLGNAALASPRRKAPGFALLGEPGETHDVILELKSVADVGLVGFPSAGKSSLIAALSAARPKIADYPFTTLVPNLGVVSAGDVTYTIADVPGLIPGAAQGKGLGLEFLRHVERCAVLLHVVDCATAAPGRDPVSDVEAVERELAQYVGTFGDLLARPRLVALNKIDVPEAAELAALVRPEFEARGLPVFEISAATHAGLSDLAYALAGEVEADRADGHRPNRRESFYTRSLSTLRASPSTRIRPSLVALWFTDPNPSAGSGKPTSTTTKRSDTSPIGYSPGRGDRAHPAWSQGRRRRDHRRRHIRFPSRRAGDEVDLMPGRRGTDPRLETSSRPGATTRLAAKRARRVSNASAPEDSDDHGVDAESVVEGGS